MFIIYSSASIFCYFLSFLSSPSAKTKLLNFPSSFSLMLDLISGWLTPGSLFILLNVMIGAIFLISRLSHHHHPKTPHPQQFGYDGATYSTAPPLQQAPSLLDRVKSINFSNYKFPLPNQDFDHYHHHLQSADQSLSAPPLERTPSILERVKSINFSLYKCSPQNPETEFVQPTEPPLISRAPSSLLERVKSIDFTSFYRSDSFKHSTHQTEPHGAEEAEPETDTSPELDHGKVKRIQSEHKVRQRKVQEKMKKSASENSRKKLGVAAGEEEEEEEADEVERRRPATTRIEKTESFGDGDQGVDAKADDFINKFKHQLKLQRLDSLLRYRDTLKGK